MSINTPIQFCICPFIIQYIYYPMSTYHTPVSDRLLLLHLPSPASHHEAMLINSQCWWWPRHSRYHYNSSYAVSICRVYQYKVGFFRLSLPGYQAPAARFQVHMENSIWLPLHWEKSSSWFKPIGNTLSTSRNTRWLQHAQRTRCSLTPRQWLQLHSTDHWWRVMGSQHNEEALRQVGA